MGNCSLCGLPEHDQIHHRMMKATSHSFSPKKKIDPRFEKAVQDKEIFPTLEEKKSDRLDFAEISKWTLLALMEQAYEMGKKDGIKTCNPGI